MISERKTVCSETFLIHCHDKYFYWLLHFTIYKREWWGGEGSVILVRESRLPGCMSDPERLLGALSGG